MSAPASSEYLLLLRNTQLEKRLSLQEMQEAMGKFTGWFAKLSEDGKLKAGQPLDDGGKVITGKQSRTVSDGPFAESKEAVGGYVIVFAEDIDEAVRLAEACPLLDYGALVEVRPIMDRCATMRLVGVEMAVAAAP
jgi:hypothetical protein